MSNNENINAKEASAVQAPTSEEDKAMMDRFRESFLEAIQERRENEVSFNTVSSSFFHFYY